MLAQSKNYQWKRCLVVATLVVSILMLSGQVTLAQQRHTVRWPDGSVTATRTHQTPRGTSTRVRHYDNSVNAWVGENPGTAAALAIGVFAIWAAANYFFGESPQQSPQATGSPQGR